MYRDPTLYLSNQGTGYVSLWKLVSVKPSKADTSTQVVLNYNAGACNIKVIPGATNSNCAGFPTEFDGYGWRSEEPITGKFESGLWTFYVSIQIGRGTLKPLVTPGGLDLYVRIIKSPDPSGKTNYVAITKWLGFASILSPASNTRYNVSGSINVPEVEFNNEYLFIEYLLSFTTLICGTRTNCPITFICNEGDLQRIDTTNLVPLPPPTGAVEYIVVNQFPMLYLSKPETAKDLISKVENASISIVTEDLPSYLIKLSKANELRSKWY